MRTFKTDTSTSSNPSPVFPEDIDPLPSSDQSSYSTYSSTSSLQSKKVNINQSAPNTSSISGDVPRDDFSDNESGSDSLDDFKIDPKSETVTQTRALFHVAEVPFNTLCQMIRSYLEEYWKGSS